MTDMAAIPTHWRDDSRVSGLNARTFKTHFLAVLWCWAHDTDVFQISNVRGDHAELIDKGLWTPVGDGVTYRIEGAPQIVVDEAPQPSQSAAQNAADDDRNLRRSLRRNAHVFSSKLYSSEFLKFWSKYPQRKGKVAAAKAYARAIESGVSPDEIDAGAERYAARCVREGAESQHIKYAQGWLNDRRWEDEDAPVAPRPYDGIPDYEQFLRGER